jgi:hypothetical protein
LNPHFLHLAMTHQIEMLFIVAISERWSQEQGKRNSYSAGFDLQDAHLFPGQSYSKRHPIASLQFPHLAAEGAGPGPA